MPSCVEVGMLVPTRLVRYDKISIKKRYFDVDLGEYS
jgi:hypothetical protein